jgi:hypothetical protein
MRRQRPFKLGGPKVIDIKRFKEQRAADGRELLPSPEIVLNDGRREDRVVEFIKREGAEISPIFGSNPSDPPDKPAA